MKVVLAQLNPVVGDLSGNLRLMEQTLRRVRGGFPDLVVFPELCVTGYPPGELLSRKWFVDMAEVTLGRVAALSAEFPGIGIVAGGVAKRRELLQNVAVLCHDGRELVRQAKSYAPFNDFFNEGSFFEPEETTQVLKFKGEVVGVSVGEDAGNPAEFRTWKLCGTDQFAAAVSQGATLLINISAQPFTVSRREARYRLFQHQAQRLQVPVVFVGQVGANDELVFDGASGAFDSQGRMLCLLPLFEEAVATVDTKGAGSPEPVMLPPDVALVYQALVLGIRDYVRKCGFQQVVVGLSGGVDSAVVCCLAAAALGADNVVGVTMPSEYSSPGSVDDSRRLADNLGVKLQVLPISDIYRRYLGTLGLPRDIAAAGVTGENIQARIRANILMALANRHGYLVLNTGNKSELAVGYCTLYGDATGGLAVLADVPKGMVYELARYINREQEIVPREVLEKAPSAELRPGQTDQETLPPYPVLDGILCRYLDEEKSPQEIIGEGFDPAVVAWVVEQIDRSEYKRRQVPPGIRISDRAFGVGRRLPIAARFVY